MPLTLYLQLRQKESRRADSNCLPLLITSDNSCVAEGSRVVQNACKLALIYLQLPSATYSSTLPVVSEWYQMATGDDSSPLSNERSFYRLGRSSLVVADPGSAAGPAQVTSTRRTAAMRLLHVHPAPQNIDQSLHSRAPPRLYSSLYRIGAMQDRANELLRTHL